jgi:hypothetical protein
VVCVVLLLFGSYVYCIVLVLWCQVFWLNLFVTYITVGFV